MKNRYFFEQILIAILNTLPERAKAHSPGQSEAAPWVMSFSPLLALKGRVFKMGIKICSKKESVFSAFILLIFNTL